MCLSPAVWENFRPHVGHWTYVGSSSSCDTHTHGCPPRGRAEGKARHVAPRADLRSDVGRRRRREAPARLDRRRQRGPGLHRFVVLLVVVPERPVLRSHPVRFDLPLGDDVTCRGGRQRGQPPLPVGTSGLAWVAASLRAGAQRTSGGRRRAVAPVLLVGSPLGVRLGGQWLRDARPAAPRDGFRRRRWPPGPRAHLQGKQGAESIVTRCRLRERVRSGTEGMSARCQSWSIFEPEEPSRRPRLSPPSGAG